MCHPGNYQSPINIEAKATFKASEILGVDFYPIHTHYHPISKQGKFTSKTFLVQGEFGTLTINPLLESIPRIYDVSQFHFHSPAEHLVDGHRHDLEMHIVHSERGKTSNISVLGFFFKNDGITNPFIDQIMRSFHNPTLIDLDLLFPNKDENGLYVYEGSLTTPPLCQGVL